MAGRTQADGTSIVSTEGREAGPSGLAVFQTAEVVREAASRLELEDAIRRRDDFIMNFAHATMSPLTPVYLQIKRLERRMTASPETVTAEWLRPRLTALCAQFDAFVRGLDDSRSLALALSGNCHLSPERVSLSATVRRVADRLKRESEAAKVPLCITLPNISMDGWWDPNRLESICLFSMSGAIRFAAERRLDVSVDGDDETASLTISGNASPTLWEEDQEVLMRKVAHRESIAGALGNGCWAARHLVRAMRGNLEIRPGASGTLAFVVNLPRHDI